MSISIQELNTTPLTEMYELLDELGEGGFGVVYKARQKGTGQLVAIKMMKSERLESANARVREEMHARFWREVKLIGQLRSPYGVRLLGAGIDDEHPYMVIELVEGRGLQEVLEDGPLSPTRTLRVMRQILEALAEAHEHGIVHRDLKPDNIMIMGRGDRLTAKVLDFGIAGIIDDFRDDSVKAVTEFGQIRGTPAYMAPEQILFFGEPRRESDIYSLGLILLECLLGRPAVMGETGSEICRKQINDPIYIPRELLQTGFGPVVEKACRKNPEDRYLSADEMLTALEGVDLKRASIKISMLLEPLPGATSNPFTAQVTGAGDPHEALADTAALTHREVSASSAGAPSPPRGALVIGATLVVAVAVAVMVFALGGSADSPETPPKPTTDPSRGSIASADARDAENRAEAGAPTTAAAATTDITSSKTDADSVTAPKPLFETVTLPAREVSLGMSQEIRDAIRADDAYRDFFDLDAGAGTLPPMPFTQPSLEVMTYEVSWGLWQTHAEAVTARLDEAARCPGEPPAAMSERSPVTGVTVAEAETLCSLFDMTLPSAQQWEAIARGPEGRRYGFQGVLSSAHIKKLHTQLERGELRWNRTPEDIYDMSGSVREWVRCDDARTYCLPRLGVDGEGEGETRYAHQGGSSTSHPVWFIASLLGSPSKHESYRCHRAADIGFRCVRPVPP